MHKYALLYILFFSLLRKQIQREENNILNHSVLSQPCYHGQRASFKWDGTHQATDFVSNKSTNNFSKATQMLLHEKLMQSGSTSTVVVDSTHLAFLKFLYPLSVAGDQTFTRLIKLETEKIHYFSILFIFSIILKNISNPQRGKDSSQQPKQLNKIPSHKMEKKLSKRLLMSKCEDLNSMHKDFGSYHPSKIYNICKHN